MPMVYGDGGGLDLPPPDTSPPPGVVPPPPYYPPQVLPILLPSDEEERTESLRKLREAQAIAEAAAAAARAAAVAARDEEERTESLRKLREAQAIAEAAAAAATAAEAAAVGDIHPDYEAGVEWTDELLDELENQALEYESGIRTLQIAGGRGPGTILATVADHKARPLGDWESDNALDINLLLGTPITAVASGYVSGAVGPCGGSRTRQGPVTKCSGHGYGLCDRNPAGIRAGFRLAVCHDSGMISFYHHMTELAVNPGARVAQGDILGYSGSANGSAHLHFAVSPPYFPEAFYARSFRLSGRKPRVAPRPTPPGVPVQVPMPVWNAPTLEGGWGQLMDVFTNSWPTATHTIRTVRRTLLDVLE